MKVQPASNMKVPLEGVTGQYVDPAGQEVPDTPYYQRAIRDGDLVTVGRPAAGSTPAPEDVGSSGVANAEASAPTGDTSVSKPTDKPNKGAK